MSATAAADDPLEPGFSRRRRAEQPRGGGEMRDDGEDVEVKSCGPLNKLASRIYALGSTAWGKEVVSYIGNTAPQIRGGANWGFKLFWAAAYLFFTGVFLFQMIILTKQYFDYDVTTSISIVRETNARFPAVGVCNNSPVRKGTIARIARFAQLAALDQYAESELYARLEGDSGLDFLYSCPDSYLPCPEGTCIPTYWVCDGTPDCADGWDEGGAGDNSSVDCAAWAVNDTYEAWNPDQYCLTGYVKCGEHEPVCAVPCDGEVECASGLDESTDLGCSQDFRCYETLNAAGTSSSFTSPNHPNNYASETDCTWEITAQAGETVRLTFEAADFSIEQDGGDCIDFVTVYNEADLENPIATVCGQTPPSEPIESSGRVMVVQFWSDYTVQQSGFSATYVSVAASRRSRRHTGAHGAGHASSARRALARKVRAKEAKKREILRNDLERALNNMRKRRSAEESRQKRSPTFDNFDAYYAWYESYDAYSDFDNISAYDWVTVYESATDPSYADFRSFALFSKDQVTWYGTQKIDFIAQCTYDGRACDEDDFVVKQNPTFGNCFYFNSILGTETKSGEFIPGIRRTSRTGQEFGLKVTLFLDKENYVGVLAPDSGVQVVLSPPTVEARPEAEAIQASAGFTTRLAVRQQVIQRKGGKYGNCESTWPDQLNFSAEFKKAWPTYSQSVCEAFCIVRRMIDTCQCTDRYFDNLEGINQDELDRGDWLCETWDKTQRDCRAKVYKDFRAGTFKCPCNPACDTSQYEHTMSTSEWPTVQFTPYFVNMLMKESRSERVQAYLAELVGDSGLTTESLTDSIRHNFLRLEIFFQDLNFEKVSEAPKYTVVNWLTDFGGNIGLWIGWSVLTMLELVVLLSGLLKVALTGTGFTH